MNKKVIRLTEGDLHRIVKESVNRVLNEIGDTPRGQYMLGRTGERALRRDDGKTMNMARQTAFRARENNPNLGKGYEDYGVADQYNHEETGRELPNRNGTLFN